MYRVSFQSIKRILISIEKPKINAKKVAVENILIAYKTTKTKIYLNSQKHSMILFGYSFLFSVSITSLYSKQLYVCSDYT